MPGASKRFPLCLRYAESLCPQGLFALLTVALGQTNSSVEFVRPLEWWIGDFKDVLFSFTKRLTWLDEDAVEKLLAKVERMHISVLIPASLLHEPNVFKWTCEVLKTNFPWVLADLVAARLALDLYLELYKKITAKANPNDSGIFVRGFSPFRADQMAFIFYAEDEDIPRQHARLHNHFSLPGRHGYAIGIACNLHAMAQRLGASLHRPRKTGTVSSEARQIFVGEQPRDDCRTFLLVPSSSAI
ncbi:hypothetical protein HPB50_000431 [Hyalomma asiaticum]|uniref:Uncharacterized protein n=1 Tax=Hyalomma asiaticum TaxID=266040 RepID=A0ACB7RNS8_HYAAI|nr:hypothetical protein HPB50_000431 [Hyalomma asiaticum]